MKAIRKSLVGITALLAVLALLTAGSLFVIADTVLLKEDQAGALKYYQVKVGEDELVYSISKAHELEIGFDGISQEKVRVKQGENVQLEIESEINCNFYIPGYGIRERVRPGETVKINFVAEKVGRYRYYCGCAGQGMLYVTA